MLSTLSRIAKHPKFDTVMLATTWVSSYGMALAGAFVVGKYGL